jgi:hypothetical protein
VVTVLKVERRHEVLPSRRRPPDRVDMGRLDLATGR